MDNLDMAILYFHQIFKNWLVALRHERNRSFQLIKFLVYFPSGNQIPSLAIIFPWIPQKMYFIPLKISFFFSATVFLFLEKLSSMIYFFWQPLFYHVFFADLYWILNNCFSITCGNDIDVWIFHLLPKV